MLQDYNLLLVQFLVEGDVQEFEDIWKSPGHELYLMIPSLNLIWKSYIWEVTRVLFLKSNIFSKYASLPSTVFLCALLWNSWEALRKTECQRRQHQQSVFQGSEKSPLPDNETSEK